MARRKKMLGTSVIHGWYELNEFGYVSMIGFPCFPVHLIIYKYLAYCMCVSSGNHVKELVELVM